MLRRSLEELRVLTRRLVSIEHDRIPVESGDFELDQVVREIVSLARSHMNVRELHAASHRERPGHTPRQPLDARACCS